MSRSRWSLAPNPAWLALGMLCALSLGIPAAHADDDNTGPAAPPSSDDTAPSQEDLTIVHRHRPVAAATTDDTSTAAQPQGQPAPVEETHRIQLFLIPQGEDTASLIGPAQMSIETEVDATPGFSPVDLVEELQPPPPDEVLQDLTQARQAVQEGNQQMTERQYAEAANRYRHAIELFSHATGEVKETDLADATVRFAIALQYSGEDDQARQAFRAAAVIDLAKKLNARTIDPDLGSGLDQARREIAQGGVGTLSVVTSPAGSRVFVGGIYRGVTPISIDHLPAGMNFVQVDRPGARRFAQLVELKEARDTPLRLRMSFSQETVELQHMLQELPAAIDHGQSYPDMVRALARRFRLQRVVIGTLRRQNENLVAVRLAIFDAAREARLADEHFLFHTDPDMLKSEATRWTRGVLDRADGSRNRSSSDPLDRSDGTEDWYAHAQSAPPPAPPPAASTATAQDSSPAPPPPPPPEKKKKKEKAKSLDQTSGTEDWDN